MGLSARRRKPEQLLLCRPGDREVHGPDQPMGGQVGRLASRGDRFDNVRRALSQKRGSRGSSGGVGFRHGSAFVPPTSLPASDHPARNLALSPVHTELPGRGGATGRARPGGFLRNGAAVCFEVRARFCPQASTVPPTPERPDKLITTANGNRLATSVGGAVTGGGA